MYAPTVLLVEPHDDSRLIYSAALRYRGYTVVETARVGDGVALARAHRPALVVLGISFPQAPSWEAVRALKAEPATARIPVLALSSTAFAEDHAVAMSLGCDEFLHKPCPPLDLLAAASGLIVRN